MTLAEAAELLRVTQDWLQRSTCPRAKIGGKVFFVRDVCLAWVRAHVTPAIRDAA
ncbi:MAG: DNA-binding protein [Gemmatimonas sp.]